MSTSQTPNELSVAEAIVSVLPQGAVVRICSDDRTSIRFAVRSEALRLRQIVLSRASLRRLVNDPAGNVKVDYLQRDLQRTATRRTEFRYPRPVRKVSRKAKAPHKVPGMIATAL